MPRQRFQRKDLKRPDEFVAEGLQLILWARENNRLLSGIGAVVALELAAVLMGGFRVSEAPAVAHHAWAEAYTDDLGWIGFDPANRICPTPSYVRLATGLDARSAAPLRGIRHGQGVENLSVEVVVSQTQQ